METAVKREELASFFRFADLYVNLREEDKRLLFAFAQGMETQRTLACNTNNQPVCPST